VQRGYTMTGDDVIRRDVIQQIMCYGVLDFDATATRHGIDFRQYFASELVALEPMVKDGLAEFAAPGLRVLPSGRLLLRHLAMAFDAYLPSVQASGQRFSKAI
jgi:oxygen-independent coproporphyrinogen-3 oxidase